ncbi:hypothetical protein ACI0YF_001798 [Cronobacter sakazakii]
MITISNERLEKLSEYDCADRYEVMSMATELLALRKELKKAEPVCFEAMPFTWEELKGMHGADFATGYVRGWERKCASVEMKGPLYTAPPAQNDRPKSEMSQKAEQLLRDTTALAVTLSAETDTTPQQFESLAFKSVVPEGWKLVPIVLTKEMRGKIHPFAEALCHGCGREVVADCEYNVTASWNDMLAVAPEPCK